MQAISLFSEGKPHPVTILPSENSLFPREIQENSTIFGLFFERKCPDLIHMGRFIEFAEMLEKRIRQEVEKEHFQREKSESRSENASVNAEFSSEFDEWPLGFAWILGQGPVLRSHPQKIRPGHKAYGVKARPPAPHRFTETQQQAFDLFLEWGTELSRSFRTADLRRAWRKAALVTHPDQGGTSADFRRAQEAYAILQTVLLKK